MLKKKMDTTKEEGLSLSGEIRDLARLLDRIDGRVYRLQKAKSYKTGKPYSKATIKKYKYELKTMRSNAAEDIRLVEYMLENRSPFFSPFEMGVMSDFIQEVTISHSQPDNKELEEIKYLFERSIEYHFKKTLKAAKAL